MKHQPDWADSLRSIGCSEVSSPPPLEDPPTDGGGHGGFRCFACGRATRPGEPFVVVERLWQVSEAVDSYRRILDAMASLQVCLPCTVLAGDHELSWEVSLGPSRGEVRGFYTFARMLADVTARRRSDTAVDSRALTETLPVLAMDAMAALGGTHQEGPIMLVEAGQCCECHEAIDSKRPNVEIEIAVNVPAPGGIELLNRFTVARYCNACSASLFPASGDAAVG